MKKINYTKALASWRSLNMHISSFKLSELETLLDFETSGQNRKTLVRRIHQRIVRVRASAERKNLTEE